MKTILITGGTGKVGIEIVRGLITDGFKVICCTRNAALAKTLFENHEHSEIRFIEVDLLQVDAEKLILSTLKAENCEIHYFIHSARSLETLKVNQSGETEGAVFLDEFRLQVLVPYQLICKFSENFKNVFQGVINIGSIYGNVTFQPQLYEGDLGKAPIQYSVSKAALKQLTQELAVRNPKLKINLVSYGGIEGRADEQFARKYSQLSPMKRMLKLDEIYGPIRFLLSSDSNYIQGHDLKVDGGWTLC